MKRDSNLKWNTLGRMAMAIVALLALVGIALQAKAALPASPSASALSTTPTKSGNISGPITIKEEKHDLSPRLDSIPPGPPITKPEAERDQGHRKIDRTGVRDMDTVIQTSFGPFAMPTPILNFDGISIANSACNCAPPDTNGEVGLNHYVQTTNSAYAVWNKSGTQIMAPVAINTLWAGFGGPCQTRNDGDPIVNYDQLADRWVISQFTSAAPYYQCIAVSQTGDPTGAFYRYAFFESNTIFGDYPKVGVWPDGYYMSTNEYIGNSWAGAGNYAFDRSRMLQGLSATAIYFHLGTADWGGQEPSDLDGSTLPPAGAPNLFVEVDDSAWDPANIPTDQIQMWRFHADFATPGNSTFTALPPITPPVLAPFDALLCNYGDDCVPQPGTASKLDNLSDRLMFRVAYRNFGTHESIVFNHTVDTGTDKSAVRWYEIRGINTTPTLYQQSTYDPDASHRWMGSIAMDQDGNAALGFSISNATTLYPSIKYAGRLVSDPLNQLTQGEAMLFAGTGSQVSTNGRWGDYSDMTVDPVDDCTFWYTQEYYATTGSFNWRTRIGSFKFPGCGVVPPTPTPAPPPCPSAQFKDVCPGSTFYTYITNLANAGIVSGYNTSPPCPNSLWIPCFRPNNTATRGQVSKIITLGANLTINTSGGPHFTDVPTSNTFYQYIETMYNAGIIGGYTSGCPSGNPCFKPNNNVTRGQLSKMATLAFNFTEPVSGQTFQDVTPGSTFYTYIQRLTGRSIINGYPCGGAGEPCIPPQNRPYFRPNANVTRGQIAKIVDLCRQQP